MTEQFMLFCLIILLLQAVIISLALSIKTRRFFFWGGGYFGKEAPYICTLLLVAAAIVTYGGYVFYSSVLLSLPIHSSAPNVLKIIYLLSSALTVGILTYSYLVELRRRYGELGPKGVFLRTLASFAVSAVSGYVMLRLGLSASLEPIKIATVFGVTFAIQMQMG